jgi:hypothetical protein
MYIPHARLGSRGKRTSLLRTCNRPMAHAATSASSSPGNVRGGGRSVRVVGISVGLALHAKMSAHGSHHQATSGECRACPGSARSEHAPRARPNPSLKLSPNGVARRPSSAGPAAHFALAVQRATPSVPASLER